MRNTALRGAVFLFTALFMASVARAECGKAGGVDGKVTIKRAKGSEGPLKTGDEVCPGDTVSTGADSFASLNMPGDAGKKPNVLRVTAGSSITVEAYEHDGTKKKVLLNVLYGKMRATVNSKYNPDDKQNPQLFQVKTKSAVAGVRGTDFLTAYAAPKGGGEPKMQITTFEGKVEVGKPGPGGSITNSQQVGAGFKAEVSGSGQVSAPKAVPSSELKQMESETKSAQGQQQSVAETKGKDSASKDSEGGDEKKDSEKKSEGDKKDSDKKSEGDKKSGDSEKKSDGDKKADGDKKGGDGEKKAAGGEGDKKASGDSGGEKKSAGGPDKGSSGGREPASTSGGDSSSSSGKSTGSGSSGSAASGSAPVAAAPPPPPPPPAPSFSGGTVAVPPPIPVIPQVPGANIPKIPDIVNQIVQTGPAKVNVKICIAGQTCN